MASCLHHWPSYGVVPPVNYLLHHARNTSNCSGGRQCPYSRIILHTACLLVVYGWSAITARRFNERVM